MKILNNRYNELFFAAPTNGLYEIIIYAKKQMMELNIKKQYI